MSIRRLLLAAASPVFNPGDKWVNRRSASAVAEVFGAALVRGIIYGGGKYVVFGGSGASENGTARVATSTDLSTWTLSNAVPSTEGITYSVAYGGGKYVASGYDTVSYSTDALTWTAATLPAAFNGQSILKVVWNGSFFLILGTTNTIATSADGITWTSQTGLGTALVGQNAVDVLWTGTLFFVISQNFSYAATSTNGVTWSAQPSLNTHVSGQTVRKITNAGQVIIGYVSRGFVMRSTNSGSSWTTITDFPVTVSNPAGVATNSVGTLAVDSFLGYAHQTTAATAYTSYPYAAGLFDAAPYVSEQFLLVGATHIDSGPNVGYFMFGQGGRLWYTVNGASITNYSLALSAQETYFSYFGAARGCATDGSVVVVAGDNGRIATSTSEDLVNDVAFMTLRSTTLSDVAAWGSEYAINAVLWDATRFIAVGANGQAATSADGTTWTYQAGLAATTWATGNALALATDGAGNTLAVGADGLVATTADGATWTYQADLRATAWGSATAVNAATWNGSLFLVGGDSGKIASSADGVTWTNITTLASTAWSTNAVYGLTWSTDLGLFIAVGAAGKIATSPDGSTWTVRTSGESSAFYAVSAASGRVIAAGQSAGSGPQLRVSIDGVTWTDKKRYLYALPDWSSNSARGVAWVGDRFVLVGDNGRMATSP